MTRYAERTEVSSESSRAEIERILIRYGADKFMYGWEGNAAMIGFQSNNRYIRFVLPLPNRDDEEFTLTETRKQERTTEAAQRSYEQAVRQRWRALALAVKAKLEAVEAGIATFEDEFLAYTVMPDNRTVGNWVKPTIQEAYEKWEMPSMLPAIEGIKSLPPPK